jgi:outer membrane lipase/esterase
VLVSVGEFWRLPRMSNLWFSRSLVALTLVAAAASAHAQSAIYVFGDSYSDVGNDFFVSSLAGDPTPPSPPYYMGRFSDGPLWIEHLAAVHGITLTPSEEGGTDYAFGGAELLAPASTPLGPIPSVEQQVAEYLEASGGKADPHALYVLTGGGNDILNAIGTGVSPAKLGATIGATLGALELVLRKAGARHFLLPYLLNVGQLPAAAADPEFAKQASVAANLVLLGLRWNPLYSAGVDLAQPDVYLLFAAIKADPRFFGFKNVTTTCLNLSPLSVCSDPAQTLWWDAEHPTEAGQWYLAYLAEASLPGRLSW